MLRTIYQRVAGRDTETPRVVDYVKAAIGEKPGAVVVDIGCGYGRTLRALGAAGIRATGIEVNPAIVEANRRGGLDCMTSGEFDEGKMVADVIVLSHVIEHFQPDKLLQFLDEKLDRLAEGGTLIIATPLLHPRFFDDFDHVKPYHPAGILMVFGGGRKQVQYYSRHELELVRLWIRRSPYAVTFALGMQMKTPATRVWQAANLALSLLHLATGGLVGRPTGWVGAFRKRGTPSRAGSGA